MQDGWVNRETGVNSRPRIVFNDVRLLSEVPKSYPRKVVVTFGIADIDRTVIHDIAALVKGSQGVNPVEIRVVDPKSGVGLSMPVHGFRIDLDQQVLDNLERVSGNAVKFEQC